MVGPKLRGSDSSLPTMNDHADAIHPVDRPDAAQVGGNTAKNATGKPFQQKMVPQSDATTLSQQMNKAGDMANSIGAGFTNIVNSLKRKP